MADESLRTSTSLPAVHPMVGEASFRQHGNGNSTRSLLRNGTTARATCIGAQPYFVLNRSEDPSESGFSALGDSVSLSVADSLPWSRVSLVTFLTALILLANSVSSILIERNGD